MKKYIGLAKNALKIGAFFVPTTSALAYANVKASEMQEARIKAKTDEFIKNGVAYTSVTKSFAKGSSFKDVVSVDSAGDVSKFSL